MSTKRRIIYVRHGQTEWNAQFRYQGKANIPLNEKGKAEARLLGERLKSWTHCRIYSSPLVRAAETARIIAGFMNPAPPVKLVEDMVEMDFGNWESHSVLDVMKKDPVLYSAWREDPSSVTPLGGETFESVKSRVKRALEGIFEDADGDILVVCHGGTIRAALTVLFDIPSSMAWRMRLGNCSLTGLDMREGISFLAFFNDVTHLRVDEGLAGSIPLGEW